MDHRKALSGEQAKVKELSELNTRLAKQEAQITAQIVSLQALTQN